MYIGPYGNPNGGWPFSEKIFAKLGPITGFRILNVNWLKRQVLDKSLNRMH